MAADCNPRPTTAPRSAHADPDGRTHTATHLHSDRDSRAHTPRLAGYHRESGSECTRVALSGYASRGLGARAGRDEPTGTRAAAGTTTPGDADRHLVSARRRAAPPLAGHRRAPRARRRLAGRRRVQDHRPRRVRPGGPRLPAPARDGRAGRRGGPARRGAAARRAARRRRRGTGGRGGLGGADARVRRGDRVGVGARAADRLRLLRLRRRARRRQDPTYGIELVRDAALTALAVLLARWPAGRLAIDGLLTARSTPEERT